MTALFLGLIFAIWRVVDGGFKRRWEAMHPLPLSWVAFGYALLAAVILGTTGPWWWALIAGVPYGLMLNKGFEDWNNPGAMLVRAWPMAFLPFIMHVGQVLGFGELTLWHGLAVALVVLSNVSQPWTRQWFDKLPGHGNWYVEAVEGACLGVAISWI